jgi:hypothetical protein
MSFSSPGEEYLYQCVGQICQAVGHKEREWDSEKLQKKIIEYFGKAYKAVSAGTKTWDQFVTDFANKFFEAFWRALGDRNWLEDVEFSVAIGAAVRSYCEPTVLAQIQSEEEFNQHVFNSSCIAFDSCRYYSWGWQVTKKVITNKTAQKKARDAVDTARDEVVAQVGLGGTKEQFIAAWIQQTIGHMAKAGGNPKKDLSEADCVRLFEELVQEGGGVPLPMVQATGPPPRNWPEISNTVCLAYQNFPDVTPSFGGGKGSGGYGAAMGGYGAAMGGYGAAMGMGGYDPWGAMKGMGKWGSPY